jgi:hypothetical protein
MIQESIRIATDNSGTLKVFRVFQLSIPSLFELFCRQNLLRCSREKHRINFEIFICLRFDPKVTAIKVFLEHEFKLINCAEYPLLPDPAPSPTAQKIIRPHSPVHIKCEFLVEVTESL